MKSAAIVATALAAALTSTGVSALTITEKHSMTFAYAERGTLTPGIVFEDDTQTQSDASFNQMPSEAESTALVGSLLGQGARSNARAVGGDIAANANFIDQSGSYERFTAYSLSTATVKARTQSLALAPGLIADESVTVDFFLPPAELRIVDFAERPASTPLVVALSIVLDVEFSRRRNYPPITIVQFDALLQTGVVAGELPWLSNFPTAEIYTFVSDDTPEFQLSVDPAYAPVRTDTVDQTGLITTTTVTFPAFSGTHLLGTFENGTDVTLSYRLGAYVSGPGAMVSGFAAVNDPFGLSGSVPSPFTVTGSNTPAAVPVPPALVLFGSVIAMAAVAQRGRRY